MKSLHNLTVGHCNIQGGLLGISKSTQISEMIKKYAMDILSLNETNLNDGITTSTLKIPATTLSYGTIGVQAPEGDVGL